jgi:hypothetical protein
VACLELPEHVGRTGPYQPREDDIVLHGRLSLDPAFLYRLVVSRDCVCLRAHVTCPINDVINSAIHSTDT